MSLQQMIKDVHRANKNWWRDLTKKCEPCGGTGCPECSGTGHPLKERNVGELLMLTTSELAEAMEGHRKDLMDDKLPHRKMFEVELADALIRILDMAGGLGLDLEGAYKEKMAYNSHRADHKIENRKADGGKAY